MNFKSIAIAIALVLFAYVVVVYENLTTMLSGVAIFIVGMSFMQDGFKQLSGGFLQKALERFTSNIHYAIITGFLSTSLVQSSTIITLITISFMSAELLTLAQGIGVIFGSNLGSTTTAWIVSSLGADVKISAYAFVMIVFGVVFRFAKSNVTKGAGSVLLGLGFIFLGIAYMKDGFEVLKDSIDFTSYAVDGFKGVFLYIAIGALATIIVQTSAASLAIAITALSSGSLTYINALAFGVGANIGTVLTAVLASFASNENGKRVAASHVIFNILTALIVTIFIYQLRDIIDFLAPLLGIDEQNYGMKLALFLTLTRVLGITILVPFIPKMVEILEKTIKPKISSAAKPKYLSEGVLSSPDISLAATRKEVINLYEQTQKAMLHAINLHTTNLSKDSLLAQLNQEFSVIDTNIDEIYQRDLKVLYSEIIKYTTFAQENMFDFQQEEAGELKRSAALLVEVLKDTRDIQKNINHYLKSKNEFIKIEYNVLRIELAEIFIDINTLASLEKEEDRSRQMEHIKKTLAQNGMASSKEIDKLIRDHKITATMATSFMNDSATAYSIQKKLVEISGILFLYNSQKDQK
ncbi:MAG: Na/Pi symporter [Sulfurimonas sp.]|jgi:phosphate:Na+ symporter|nr:Na/Pi symporter [Sulfurimonadaceae bacterium]